MRDELMCVAGKQMLEHVALLWRELSEPLASFLAAFVFLAALDVLMQGSADRVPQLRVSAGLVERGKSPILHDPDGRGSVGMSCQNDDWNRQPAVTQLQQQ